MKTIVLHGSAPDNAGDHHPAGTKLTVDDHGGKGCIAADRAAQLVKINSAKFIDSPATAAARQPSARSGGAKSA